MNDGEALLRGVAERMNKLDQDSDTDIKVPGVNSPNIRNHDVVVELFGVSLKYYKDIDDFTKGIELGKYLLWSKLTREKRKEVLYTIGDIWDALVEKSVTRANSIDPVVSKSSVSVSPTFDNIMPSKVPPNDPIVQSVYIHEQPNSYVGATGGSKTKPFKPKANFCSFCSFCSKNLYDGAKFSIPRKVIETISTRFGNTLCGYFIGKRIAFLVMEYYARNNWGKFARCLIEINVNDALQESLTLGIPLIEDHYPKKVSITPSVVTSNVATLTVEKTNDGFQTMGKKKKKKKKKKKGKSKSTNGGQFDGHPVKQTVRYEPKATTSAPKRELLMWESEEEVENVYDESANLLQSKKIGGSSPTFTIVVG
nr:hypothetical protein [Tanacetum cinerariifolium]